MLAIRLDLEGATMESSTPTIHSPQQATVTRRDWNGLTKHLGAKAYDAYDTLYEGVVLMTKSKPEVT